jgi:hypothetical protein
MDGLPMFSAAKTVIIQNDSGFVSSSSLPRMDSVGFVLLDSTQIRELADHLGDVNVLRVWRPLIGADTALSGASSHWVWGQDNQRMMAMSACAFRLRRLSGAWQVDSTIGCVIT